MNSFDAIFDFNMREWAASSDSPGSSRRLRVVTEGFRSSPHRICFLLRLGIHANWSQFMPQNYLTGEILVLLGADDPTSLV